MSQSDHSSPQKGVTAPPNAVAPTTKPFTNSNYSRFRGKCKEYSEALAANNPELTIVRGWYYCPVWNSEEEHWWCKDQDGNIHDPTKLQFPSAGIGEYKEFDGYYPCIQCGEPVHESQLMHQGFCSTKCACACVGI